MGKILLALVLFTQSSLATEVNSPESQPTPSNPPSLESVLEKFGLAKPQLSSTMTLVCQKISMQDLTAKYSSSESDRAKSERYVLDLSVKSAIKNLYLDGQTLGEAQKTVKNILNYAGCESSPVDKIGTSEAGINVGRDVFALGPKIQYEKHQGDVEKWIFSGGLIGLKDQRVHPNLGEQIRALRGDQPKTLDQANSAWKNVDFGGPCGKARVQAQAICSGEVNPQKVFMAQEAQKDPTKSIGPALGPVLRAIAGAGIVVSVSDDAVQTVKRISDWYKESQRNEALAELNEQNKKIEELKADVQIAEREFKQSVEKGPAKTQEEKDQRNVLGEKAGQAAEKLKEAEAKRDALERKVLENGGNLPQPKPAPKSYIDLEIAYQNFLNNEWRIYEQGIAKAFATCMPQDRPYAATREVTFEDQPTGKTCDMSKALLMLKKINYPTDRKGQPIERPDQDRLRKERWMKVAVNAPICNWAIDSTCMDRTNAYFKRQGFNGGAKEYCSVGGQHEVCAGQKMEETLSKTKPKPEVPKFKWLPSSP